ncbi:hypothetical protein CH251_26995 [Rhodococcus sp. 06-462-5]|uniref:aldo/keto reductase n=1 Tax=unclassified Rhodococcus (in: high G+C Gram-positive bacteria) TaxID=192944 RepID=UPI000B9BAF51|nr:MULTISPECIES: aldo/keto reductase [unclassified Rhodococcus (in: high G+C Gram-positive bacteria)]OZC63830.1 hypothetical protein CH251_26995 [Rhodococcus sp. 06-462-5]OZE61585.1 hypothetical protein CH270_21120 [Rhodococcus sp. 02-925g]
MTTSALKRRFLPVLLGTGNFGGDAGTVASDIGLDAAGTTAILDHAVEVGVMVFDTVDIYAQGATERIVAEWRSAHADADVLIQTQAGSSTTSRFHRLRARGTFGTLGSA